VGGSDWVEGRPCAIVSRNTAQEFDLDQPDANAIDMTLLDDKRKWTPHARYEVLDPQCRFATVVCRVAKGYSITSSAVASKVGGIEMPSAMAVFILITRSNLVGPWIGSSLGLSPRNIRST
jgi:hypothetical protein